MKCLIFSDSHGDFECMKRALDMHRDAEAVFFLGDGLRDAEIVSEFDSQRTWFYVRGNCDFKHSVNGSPVPKTDEVTLEGKKIVYTHGDLYGVKLSDEGLYSLVRERAADIILFGHTHKACENYVSIDEKGVYLFNPGTIGYSPRASSYGILNIDEEKILFSIGTFL